MKFMSNLAVVAACVGMLIPQSVLAQTVPNATKHAKPPVRDLVLGEGGALQGQVVDAQNAPITNTKVLVVAGGKRIRETTTDAQGRFVVSGLKSGHYAVGSQGGFAIYRTWTAAVAPPGAPNAALIVDDGRVVRGQGMIWYWLTNPWVVSLGIAAAIAVPIAANNNKKPSS